ncbi:MAG: TetR/AcrR family transcriptional regulator [Alphaproteobacteria bacterium]|nr:TetR/AcrR family transcriptional regulator [Alphaproteobacteria bacterium]
MEQEPQQARAVRTRQAVVDAAVACLAGQGLAGSSTAAVARTAGVSQGALFRYFPTKVDLLAAAVQAVLAGLVARFVDEVAADPRRDGDDLLAVGLRALWAVFTDPALYGVYEVFLAARTDPALQQALDPILAAHADAELAVARRLFPVAAQQVADFDAVVIGLLTTLQGAAIGVAARPADGPPIELGFIETLIRSVLGLPAWSEDP